MAIFLIFLIVTGLISQCGEDGAIHTSDGIDLDRYCAAGAAGDASCRNPAPTRGLLLGRVPQLPPWRLEGGLWHIGATTAAMLRDLAANESFEGPTELALQFLARLDEGTLSTIDLGTLCASVLRHMPVYWRNARAWTSKPDGSGTVTFAEVPHIPSLLHYTLRVLLSQWHEISEEKGKHLETFLMVADFTFSFLRIHPFLDGNGRCSRWMAGWMMYRELGFELKLPDANETTRYTMSQMAIPRYLMLQTLNEHDASLLAAFLIDCAWDQLQRGIVFL